MRFTTIFLAISVIAPILAAPVPRPESCAGTKISFLGPRRRSILSIRSACDEVETRAAADEADAQTQTFSNIVKRDAGADSFADRDDRSRIISIPRLAEHPFEESGNVFDISSSDFELVSAPESGEESSAARTYIIATDRITGKTQLIEGDFESSNPFTSYGGAGGSDMLDAVAWDANLQQDSRTILAMTASIPEALEIAGAVMVVGVLLTLLVVDRALAGRRKRRVFT